MEQHNGEANGSGGDGGSAYLCRPSGTRWIPTSEQIRILRELYYSCGIRSPNSEQIQRIAAMLRQYGKIEGKNVFYWFQNHKARERQKKRLTTLDVPPPSAAADDSHAQLLSPSHANGAMAPSSPSTVYTSNGAVPMEASAWDSHGPAVAERSFLDCLGVRSTATHTTAPTSWAYLSDQTARRAMPRELETLPLFPISDSRRPRHGDQEEQCQETSHGSYLSGFQCWGASTAPSNQQQQLMQLQEQHQYYSSSSNQLSGDDAAAAAGTSLELTLSSYCCPYPAGSM